MTPTVEQPVDFWHRRYAQQATWTQALREHILGRAGIEKAQRVLEVGCGTGAIWVDVAIRKSLAMHGLDIEMSHLLKARSIISRMILTCGDANTLPYSSHSFEITCCHFLLLWLHDPLRALQEMARVTKPGGHVLAFGEPDYGKREDYPTELVALGCWQTQALRRMGADPEIGSRLAELFTQAGLRLVETGTLGRIKTQLQTPEEWELEWAVLENDLAGTIPAQELQEMRDIDQHAWERGERLLYVPTYFAWGQVA